VFSPDTTSIISVGCYLWRLLKAFHQTSRQLVTSWSRPKRSCAHPCILPSFKISLTQWVTIFRCTENHPLVFSSSKIMFTWHICYTSNSASSQFIVQSMITLKIRRPTPRYYRNKSPRPQGITVNLVPVPAVLPWSWSPSARCYRELCSHYHGITAGKPWSTSPCSSLDVIIHEWYDVYCRWAQFSYCISTLAALVEQQEVSLQKCQGFLVKYFDRQAGRQSACSCSSVFMC